MKETTIIASSQDIEKAKKFGEELVNKGLSVQIRSMESATDFPKDVLILWLTPAAKGEMAVKTTQFNEKGIRVINYFSVAMELTPDEKKSLGRFPSIFHELYNEESAAATALLINDFPATPLAGQSQSTISLEESSYNLKETNHPNLSREVKTPESLINPDTLSKEEVNKDATPQVVASSDAVENIEVPRESNMVSDEPNIDAKPAHVQPNKTVENTPRIKPSTIGIKANPTPVAQPTGNSVNMVNLNNDDVEASDESIEYDPTGYQFTAIIIYVVILLINYYIFGDFRSDTIMFHLGNLVEGTAALFCLLMAWMGFKSKKIWPILKSVLCVIVGILGLKGFWIGLTHIGDLF